MKHSFAAAFLILSTGASLGCAAAASAPSAGTVSVVDVAPYRTICLGEALSACLSTREGDARDYRLLYFGIEDFRFEWAYTQRIEIERIPVPTPDQDAPGDRVINRRVIAKTPLPPGTRLVVSMADEDLARSWKMAAVGSCEAGYRLFGEKDLVFDGALSCADFASKVAAATPRAVEVEVVSAAEPLRVIALVDAANAP